MLRAAGGVDRKKLLQCRRTLLRYSLEHLDKKQRDHYLSMKTVGSKPAGKSVDARLNE
jgi:hypothetical protein